MSSKKPVIAVKGQNTKRVVSEAEDLNLKNGKIKRQRRSTTAASTASASAPSTPSSSVVDSAASSNLSKAFKLPKLPKASKPTKSARSRSSASSTTISDASIRTNVSESEPGPLEHPVTSRLLNLHASQKLARSKEPKKKNKKNKKHKKAKQSVQRGVQTKASKRGCVTQAVADEATSDGTEKPEDDELQLPDQPTTAGVQASGRKIARIIPRQASPGLPPLTDTEVVKSAKKGRKRKGSNQPTEASVEIQPEIEAIDGQAEKNNDSEVKTVILRFNLRNREEIRRPATVEPPQQTTPTVRPKKVRVERPPPDFSYLPEEMFVQDSLFHIERIHSCYHDLPGDLGDYCLILFDPNPQHEGNWVIKTRQFMDKHFSKYFEFKKRNITTDDQRSDYINEILRKRGVRIAKLDYKYADKNSEKYDSTYCEIDCGFLDAIIDEELVILEGDEKGDYYVCLMWSPKFVTMQYMVDNFPDIVKAFLLDKKSKNIRRLKALYQKHHGPLISRRHALSTGAAAGASNDVVEVDSDIGAALASTSTGTGSGSAAVSDSNTDSESDADLDPESDLDFAPILPTGSGSCANAPAVGAAPAIESSTAVPAPESGVQKAELTIARAGRAPTGARAAALARANRKIVAPSNRSKTRTGAAATSSSAVVGEPGSGVDGGLTSQDERTDGSLTAANTAAIAAQAKRKPSTGQSSQGVNGERTTPVKRNGNGIAGDSSRRDPPWVGGAAATSSSPSVREHGSTVKMTDGELTSPDERTGGTPTVSRAAAKTAPAKHKPSTGHSTQKVDGTSPVKRNVDVPAGPLSRRAQPRVSGAVTSTVASIESATAVRKPELSVQKDELAIAPPDRDSTEILKATIAQAKLTHEDVVSGLATTTTPVKRNVPAGPLSRRPHTQSGGAATSSSPAVCEPPESNTERANGEPITPGTQTGGISTKSRAPATGFSIQMEAPKLSAPVTQNRGSSPDINPLLNSTKTKVYFSSAIKNPTGNQAVAEAANKSNGKQPAPFRRGATSASVRDFSAGRLNTAGTRISKATSATSSSANVKPRAAGSSGKVVDAQQTAPAVRIGPPQTISRESAKSDVTISPSAGGQAVAGPSTSSAAEFGQFFADRKALSSRHKLSGTHLKLTSACDQSDAPDGALTTMIEKVSRANEINPVDEQIMIVQARVTDSAGAPAQVPFRARMMADESLGDDDEVEGELGGEGDVKVVDGASEDGEETEEEEEHQNVVQNAVQNDAVVADAQVGAGAPPPAAARGIGVRVENLVSATNEELAMLQAHIDRLLAMRQQQQPNGE